MEHQCPNTLYDLVSLRTCTLLCGSQRMDEDRQRDTADIVKESVSLKAKAIDTDMFGKQFRDKPADDSPCAWEGAQASTPLHPLHKYQVTLLSLIW